MQQKYNFLNALEYSENSVNVLQDVCAPLFKAFPIKTFSYTKINVQNNFLYCSTNREWLRFRYDNSIWGVGCNKFRENIANIPKGGVQSFVWAGTPPETKYFSCLHDYDIWNGGIIVERNAESIEVWGFTGGKNSFQSVDFFLNNINLLSSYILYIKDKANKIINVCDSQKFINYTNCYIPECQKPENNFELMMEKLNIRRFFLDCEDSSNYLTKRQADCLHYYMQGYTIKEIGIILNISSRTVEFYIENIKLKLNCTSRQQLRKKILKSFLNLKY